MTERSTHELAADVRTALAKGGWPGHDFQGVDIDQSHDPDACRICNGNQSLDALVARVADLEAALTEIVAANPQGKLSLRGGESWEIARRALDATDGEGQ